MRCFFYHPIHLKNPAVSWFKTGETDNRLRHVILPNFIPSRPIEVQTTFSVLGEKWGYACCWVENRAKNVSPLRDGVCMVFENRIMRIIGLRTGRPRGDRPYDGGACVVFFYHPIHLKNPAVSWFKTGETDNRLRHVILPNFIPSRPIEVQTTFSVWGEKWGYACCWVENRAKDISPLRDGGMHGF